MEPLHIIGGGMAGSEAAWQAASAGVPVVLHEMRPTKGTFAHRTGDFAEMVCSNSFRSDDSEQNAVGLLHWEMRAAGGLILEAAEAHRLPAGGALAVDRDPFAAYVTTKLKSHPLISVSYEEVTELPSTGQWIIATGPVTSTSLAESIRREVRAVDPNEPVFSVRTMDAVVASAMAERRFTMVLLALFATTALALSAIGIYGVMAYFVTQRTHEIGIRMALGATRRDVVGMVLHQGVRLAAAGVVAGVIGALLATRAISALLFNVGPRDPWTIVALSATLTAVALLACYIPARRATRVDPIRALRYE